MQLMPSHMGTTLSDSITKDFDESSSDSDDDDFHILRQRKILVDSSISELSSHIVPPSTSSKSAQIVACSQPGGPSPMDTAISVQLAPSPYLTAQEKAKLCKSRAAPPVSSQASLMVTVLKAALQPTLSSAIVFLVGRGGVLKSIDSLFLQYL
ncbi:hypothetical protein OUZ56_005479 [Daphnia magna]|uniref:Uncharacterized protein n=1 Tax=Daphnia magna TaxID=35525 RepID=A0ABQ9YSW2_9CRUS|nr:hypothetical protein OUZ56_005479 [Daphnia magna]